MSLKVTKDGLGALKKRLQRLAERQVLVGIPAEHAPRDLEPEQRGPITNAALGYIHENGSPAANIPARPWLYPGVSDARGEIVARYKAGAKAVLDGRVADSDAVHQAVGLIAEASLKKKLTDGAFAPLAPATIAARQRRGRNSTKPLTDTGQLRNAVTHVVRRAGKI